MLDTSLYNRQGQVADIGGGFRKGLSMGQMVRNKKLQDQELERKQGVRDAYSNNMVKNRDGSVSFDRGSLLSEMGKYDPEAAMRQQEQFIKQDLMKQRQQESIQDRKFDRDYKNKMLGIRKDQIKSDEMRSQIASYKENEKKKEETYVPGIGYANNREDAKKLKDAKEMKAKFDRQMNELIDLRKEYGVEYFNREAVGRGKQLSKDLLLTYKNLAKLGVLSKSDEDIINAIIPSDPLGQDYMLGQDSILHQLEKFKGDLDSDYKTTLSTRLKSKEKSSSFSKEEIMAELMRRKKNSALGAK